MKKQFYVVLLALLLVISFMAGALFKQRADGKADKSKTGQRILYYVDPMNPSHISDSPGTAPCGMPLEPVYADDDEAASPGGRPPAAAANPAAMKVGALKQQRIGVLTGPVESTATTRLVRTLGRVVPNENRVHRMLAGSDGWMWAVHESTTGSLVEKNQLMAAAYNYQFLTREQQYLFALDRERITRAARERSASARPPGSGTALQKPPDDSQQVYETVSPDDSVFINPVGVEASAQGRRAGAPAPPRSDWAYYINDPVELAKLELYNLGAGEYQLKEMARTGKLSMEMEVRAPVKGVVLSRNVSPLQRFEKGAELFRIADISRVWIVADVFERDAKIIRPGIPATITLRRRGEPVETVVSDVLPQFDSATRTYKVRMEIDNPDYSFLPDAFVDVEFRVPLPEALTVPVDSVINTGTRGIVFVDLGQGFYEPREVETGRRDDDRVEILKGVAPGEKVVVSGNFLLESESRMKMAAGAGHHHSGSEPMNGGAARRETEKDPVCGMPVDPEVAVKEGFTVEHDGKTFYFCSEACKSHFQRNTATGNGAAHETHRP